MKVYLSPTNRIHKYITYNVYKVRQILVARTLLLARHPFEEQPNGAAIVPVAGSFFSSSATVACFVTNGANSATGELTLRFGFNLLHQGDLFDCLTPCTGCVPPTTFKIQPFSRTPNSVFHTDRSDSL
jgi:hypothetical protein